MTVYLNSYLSKSLSTTTLWPLVPPDRKLARQPPAATCPPDSKPSALSKAIDEVRKPLTYSAVSPPVVLRGLLPKRLNNPTLQPLSLVSSNFLLTMMTPPKPPIIRIILDIENPPSALLRTTNIFQMNRAHPEMNLRMVGILTTIRMTTWMIMTHSMTTSTTTSMRMIMSRSLVTRLRTSQARSAASLALLVAPPPNQLRAPRSVNQISLTEQTPANFGPSWSSAS